MSEKVREFERMINLLVHEVEQSAMHPESIGRIAEARIALTAAYAQAIKGREPPPADKEKLSPREALLAALDEIDSGRLDPRALVVCFTHADNGTGFVASAPDVVTEIGLLECTKLHVHDLGRSRIA